MNKLYFCIILLFMGSVCAFGGSMYFAVKEQVNHQIHMQELLNKHIKSVSATSCHCRT